FGGRGAPVDQQRVPVPVHQADPADVTGAAVIGDDPAQADLEAEALQQPEPGAEPVDLQVPVHRLLAATAGCPTFCGEPLGEVGDSGLQVGSDRGEVCLVAGDQCRVGFGSQVVGEVEDAGGQVGHPSLRSGECATVDSFSAPHELGRELL